jgi:hypothetical protein
MRHSLCCFLNYEAANRRERRVDCGRKSVSRAILDTQFVGLNCGMGRRKGEKQEKGTRKKHLKGMKRKISK